MESELNRLHDELGIEKKVLQNVIDLDKRVDAVQDI